MGQIVYACIAPHPPVLVPEVGGGREKEVQSTVDAMGLLAERLRRILPETVLLMSPHGPGQGTSFAVVDAERATGSLSRFGAPQVMLSFRVDRLLVDEIAWRAGAAGLPMIRSERWASVLDWGCVVPLYFLRNAMGSAGLVTLSASGGSARSHFELGQAAAQAVANVDRRVAVVCSADLSHALKPGAPAGFYPRAEAFDREYREAVEAWDVEWMLSQDPDEMHLAAEDAVRQTAFLMGVLDGLRVTPQVHSYEGPFGVGYLVASLEVCPREARV